MLQRPSEQLEDNIDKKGRTAFVTAGLLSLRGGMPIRVNGQVVGAIAITNAKPGDFDQMAVDLQRNRVFVSAESSNLIEVFALRSGKFVGTISGVKAPHRLAIEKPSGDLLAAIGGDDQVRLYNPAGKLLGEVATAQDPDGGVLDRANGVFYVGSRVGQKDQHESELQGIDAKTLRVVSTVDLPASTLKGMVVDKARDVLFVSTRDKNAIPTPP